MKYFFNLFFIALVSHAAISQQSYQLRISHLLNDQVFALNKVVKHPEAPYQTKFSRLTYYITGLQIVHDGGKLKNLPEIVFLVYSQKDSIFDLGQLGDVNEVESIRFAIGVDSARNHLDPSSYGPLHPLAPQNPDMHWGWSAGYRFAAIEGKAGTGFTQSFEIHALGDQNYFTTEIPVKAQIISANKKEIHINANYGVLLKGLDVSQGLFMHGSTGAAVTILENFKNYVFTSDVSSKVNDPIAHYSALHIFPNPINDNQIRFTIQNTSNSAAVYSIYATSGQKLISGYLSLHEKTQTIPLNNNLQEGIYFLELKFEDGRREGGKFIKKINN